MVFKTFAVGEVLESSEVNDYLMKQTVVVCTSGTRPSSPPEGMVIYETDTDNILAYDGTVWNHLLHTGAWVSYSTTWAGATTNPTLGNGTLVSKYKQRGKSIELKIALQAGSTTTFGSGAWSFTLPTPFPVLDNSTIAAFADDNSASARYGGSAWLEPSVDQVFRVVLGTGGNTGVASTVPFTWATSDRLLITGTYEADI